MTAVVNDVRSRLNPTAVAEVVQPRSLEELQEVVRRAARARPLALCGGRHGMGGQQFCSGGVLVNTHGLARALSVDTDEGLVEVEAGIGLSAIADALVGSEWSVRQLQKCAGSSVAGAASVNAHGRGLVSPPFVADVERLVVVDAGGEGRICSRDLDPELFGVVCGGYGLFGAIHSVTLRLVPRARLERLVVRTAADDVIARLASLADEGYLTGDVRLDPDAASPGFLSRGVLACERLVAPDTPLTAAPPRVGLGETLQRLVRAHRDDCFDVYAERLLATSGEVYDPEDRVRTPAGTIARWPGSSEMRTELHVPRPSLADFLADAAAALCLRVAKMVSATVRLVEREEDTMLAWAREPWACVTIDLHVEHDAVAVGRAADAFRALIDVALDHGGSYHLAYHRWARRDQLEAAHPQIHAFLDTKEARDPRGVFQSDWYRHVLALLGRREAA